MLSFNEASELINSIALPLKTANIRVSDASGLVAASDVFSKFDYPLENNSAMDGYAINSSRLNRNRAVTIDKNTVFAGSDIKNTVFAGSRDNAVRIMTGGRLPEGFDAVVPVENVVVSGDSISIKPDFKLKQWINIRIKGEDIKNGDLVLKKKERLTPEIISMLLSCGIRKVKIFDKISAGVVSTGNEILNIDSRPVRGKIYNSNGILAENFLKQNGCNISFSSICRDNIDEIASALSQAAKSSNIIITSAGASFGDKDFTEKALDSIGFKIKFRQVSIKPGKPFSFGMLGKIPVFMLPGNPFAFYACLVMFVGRFIANQGFSGSMSVPVKTRALFRHSANSKRTEFIPAFSYFKDGCIQSEIIKKYGSAAVSPFRAMNSIISIPESSKDIAPGDLVDTCLLKL